MIDKLHYISQAPEEGSHLTAIEKVLRSGGKWIQLRVKEQHEDNVLALAEQANLLCLKYQARLIVNDYPRIALQSGAYGVHLGLDDMPVPEARMILGAERCIGGTANTFEDVLRRADEGVDYIGLGPYHFTTTKKNLSPTLGLEGYIRIMGQIREAGIKIPVIAIGGIERADIDPILSTGIHGIAVSGLLTRSNDLNEEFYVHYSR
ncbi:thiamine-phosphate diphosphorylase [Pedobacter hartonius]|uniref:Thiamine-phosphate synthase n=2 Tax=Pedobacter hartonius TaxID=425514 RepID=A0A1H3X4I6_9SPHI|nr:thiamine-phosphate diphosphorylase [Pedobacter hartonius]